MIATIVIPVAPAHEAIAQEAVRSAERQSLRCALQVVHDHEGRGAGWARNQGAAKAETPFVTFLDADDLLAPAFVEQCLQHYERGRYIYSDWQQEDGDVVTLPDCTCHRGWYAGRIFQLVTTLIPTVAFRGVGGFDESLPTMEDLDFYLRLQRLGVCGYRCPEPLVTYRARRGQRAKLAVEGGYHEKLLARFRAQYGGPEVGCCDGVATPVVLPEGEKHEGDVKAETLWAGIQTEGSWFAQRAYRGGDGRVIWVDPRDVQARPNKFRIHVEPSDQYLGPARADVLRMAAEAVETIQTIA